MMNAATAIVIAMYLLFAAALIAGGTWLMLHGHPWLGCLLIVFGILAMPEWKHRR